MLVPSVDDLRVWESRALSQRWGRCSVLEGRQDYNSCVKAHDSRSGCVFSWYRKYSVSNRLKRRDTHVTPRFEEKARLAGRRPPRLRGGVCRGKRSLSLTSGSLRGFCCRSRVDFNTLSGCLHSSRTFTFNIDVQAIGRHGGDIGIQLYMA